LLIDLAGDASFLILAKGDAEVLAARYRENVGRQIKLLSELRPVWIIAIAVEKAEAATGLFAIGWIRVENSRTSCSYPVLNSLIWLVNSK